MTRRITQTFHGFDKPEVIVTLPEYDKNPGEHQGVLRAWAVDDETGDWWGMCEYYVATGVQLLGWISTRTICAVTVTSPTTTGACSGQPCPPLAPEPAITELIEV